MWRVPLPASLTGLGRVTNSFNGAIGSMPSI
jgi:hypothetical protein